MTRRPDLNMRSAVRRLGRRIRRLEAAAVDNARGQQASWRGIHGGDLTIYDAETDEELIRVGKQPEGSYGVRHLNNPKPPTPSVPLVAKIIGGATVTWDGYDENDEISWDEDTFSHVNVHNFTVENDDPDEDNLIGTIVSRFGGAITVAQPEDAITYVVLVAVSRSGRQSDPSEAAKVDGGGKMPQWENGDQHVLTEDDVAAGMFEKLLSYKPLSESVQGAWGALIQPPGAFEVDYSIGMVTWPLNGFEQPGDLFHFHYQHIKDSTSDLPINYGEDWLYIVHPSYDLAMMQEGYDDSAWLTGTAPFGNQSDDTTDIGGTASPRGLMVRRVFHTKGGPLKFYTNHWDDRMRVHIDGVEVLHERSYDSPHSAMHPGPLDEIVTVSPGRHLLAVYNTSDIAGGNNSWDLTVTEVDE